MPAEIAALLLSWYAQSARSLPWRGQRDAYAVWVSEMMLQQTRVETVIPYYQRWMARFPNLPSLAAASEQEVLQLWEGLGYYSRARNLLRTARQVVAEFSGEMPSGRRELQRLPGIGRCTAAAIASIAFGQDEPALDGNIRRVLARLFDLRIPARSPQGEARLWELASQELPAGQAGDFNQALMDLGATLCTPRQPNCAACPLAEVCQAYHLGVQEQRPLLESRSPIPHYLVTTAVIHRQGCLLIARRPSKGLLGGLWEFPGGKVQPGEQLAQGLQREIIEELGVEIAVGAEMGIYRHAYTHFKVTLHAFTCHLVKGEPQPLQASALHWAAPAELAAFPMGKIDRQIAKQITSDRTICPVCGYNFNDD